MHAKTRDKNLFSSQVQAQARERRRSDRKEKRELDKEKALAEYRARELEGKFRPCFPSRPVLYIVPMLGRGRGLGNYPPLLSVLQLQPAK